jgi:hypothetical protein
MRRSQSRFRIIRNAVNDDNKILNIKNKKNSRSGPCLGIRQYLTIFSGQLVEFLESEFQSVGPCHIAFLIIRGTTYYLKVTNVVRNEPIVDGISQDI